VNRIEPLIVRVQALEKQGEKRFVWCGRLAFFENRRIVKRVDGRLVRD
jgi:hypothetical protein